MTPNTAASGSQDRLRNRAKQAKKPVFKRLSTHERPSALNTQNLRDSSDESVENRGETELGHGRNTKALVGSTQLQTDK